MPVTAGPKRRASIDPLPLILSKTTDSAGDRLARWASEWIIVPKGLGAGDPLILHRYQRDQVDALNDPLTRLLVWVAGRGNAKSTTSAVIGLNHITEGPIGAACAIVSTGEREAARLLATAVRMVDASPALSERVTCYADRLVCARTGGELLIVPAEQRRVEGLDLSLAIVDEVGWVEADVFESMMLSLKAPGARMLAVGTPSPAAWRDRSPLWALVQAGRAGEEPGLVLIEHTSDPTHEVDCVHCWESANPGLDLVLPREHLAASLPPKVRRSEYERARLGRWVETDVEAWLPPGAWAARSTGQRIAPGTDVVLALDGSFSQDTTALVAATVSACPHLDVIGLWQAPPNAPDWRVDVLAVEQAIRNAARTFRVVEVAADPFRWQRSLQVLASDGLPVVEHPQTSARMSPAITELREAVINAQMTQSGDVELSRHVTNARLQDDARGVRLVKPSKNSTRRIDLAVAAVMAHARARWHASQAKPRRRLRTINAGW